MTCNFIFRLPIAHYTIPVNLQRINQIETEYQQIKDFIQILFLAVEITLLNCKPFV